MERKNIIKNIILISLIKVIFKVCCWIQIFQCSSGFMRNTPGVAGLPQWPVVWLAAGCGRTGFHLQNVKIPVAVSRTNCMYFRISVWRVNTPEWRLFTVDCLHISQNTAQQGQVGRKQSDCSLCHRWSAIIFGWLMHCKDALHRRKFAVVWPKMCTGNISSTRVCHMHQHVLWHACCECVMTPIKHMFSQPKKQNCLF